MPRFPEAEDTLSMVSNFLHSHPETVLGKHVVGGKEVVRFLAPRSVEAWIESGGRRYRVSKVRENLYEGEIDKHAEGRYQICFRDASGYVTRRRDPFTFEPLLSDYEIYLFKKGELIKAYETFGSHLLKYPDVNGVRFVVWAPNAQAVSVVGNFNHWNVGENPMINVKDSGIWEIFIPGIGNDEVYKYAIRGPDGKILEKTDPYAFKAELRPRTASVVSDTGFIWEDDDWLRSRALSNPLDNPVSVYEVHLGSWLRDNNGGFLNYKDLAHRLADHISDLGFTHVELLPIMEHPLDASWGYQVVNYFAPTSRYGAPDDFRYFVNYLHKQGIGVILDWVPAHFPQDEYGLGRYDGTHLYEHEDPRLGRHPDWGTYIFNYGRGEVVSFLLSNAHYWVEQYHADGIRIDAVSSMLYLDYSRRHGEWIPNRFGGHENLEAIEFLKKLNDSVHIRHPGVLMIAEESTSWSNVTGTTSSGGLGFDMKWNMGWMHDVLDFFMVDPIFRKYKLGNLTFTLWYAYSEKFILPLSHDEVVHGKGSLYGKMPGDEWQKLANLRLLYSFMFLFPGKKLLFMGSEIPQRSEWNFDAQLEWSWNRNITNQTKKLLDDLNLLYRKSGLARFDFVPDAFRWIDFKDSDNTVISFIRGKPDTEELICVFNFTPVQRYGYRVGVPSGGKFKEIFNSDSSYYGGSNKGNFGIVEALHQRKHDFEYSVSLTLPPLSCVVLGSENNEYKETE
ncbi:1,4-alpha-glucan branching protein GlgB [Thermoplasmatales archaeon AK]|nr:1,4-alpha-glucan branching protein GlgB [Thermoplasmatales archaeon AK]